MTEQVLHNWPEFQDWAAQLGGIQRYIFRGQSDSTWPLRTSLARHFLKNKVAPNEWRKRELKMYKIFRQHLLKLCPGLYDNWNSLDILSLMQHHGTPTRLIDFTYSPFVAAYFALREASGDSAIWVIDSESLSDESRDQGRTDFCGPTHKPDYKVAVKHIGASVLKPTYPHPRLAAQQGIFLVPGQISKEIGHNLIHAKVILSETLVLESIMKLKGEGIDKEYLFPDFDEVARTANRFSVTGSADV